MYLNNELPSRQTRSLLAALQWRGYGVTAVRKLAIEAMGSRNWDLQELARGMMLKAGVPSSAQMEEAQNRAEEIVEKCGRLGIYVVSLADPEYPRRLRGIKDAPPFLYIRGNIHSLQSDRSIAVVGTRKASKVGLSLAKQIAQVLSMRGWTTVSGLALGIDTAAHTGALRERGLTIAVLAHGLDIVAPATNRPLAEDILANEGALVSEHPPGVPPHPPEFVRRNRIQSGLSAASIIVESGAVGGSIHQARFTVEQGRMLFAVMPPANIPHGESFNREGGGFLHVSMGARYITSREDLLGLLDAMSTQAITKPSLGVTP